MIARLTLFIEARNLLFYLISKGSKHWSERTSGFVFDLPIWSVVRFTKHHSIPVKHVAEFDAAGFHLGFYEKRGHEVRRTVG